MGFIPRRSITLVSLSVTVVVIVASVSFYYLFSRQRVIADTISFNSHLSVIPTKINESSFGLSEYFSIDAFPGTERLWGAMQVREDPRRAGVYFVATFRGDLVEVTRMMKQVDDAPQITTEPMERASRDSEPISLATVDAEPTEIAAGVANTSLNLGQSSQGEDASRAFARSPGASAHGSCFVGLKVRTVLSLASAKIGWMYSFAIHPQFGNGDPKLNKVFVFYRSNDEAKKKFYRVSAFTLTDAHPAEAMDEEVLIEQEIGHYEHLGGALEFDTDGFLLIAVGDNGLHNDLSENSQKIDKSLFSCVLRIDVDCKGGSVSRHPRTYPVGAKTKGYFIPLDNPFLNVSGAHGEFWSIGFRNPFRMSFDPVTKKAWIGEVGQDRIEQVEVASSGSNHLWSFREGTEMFSKSYLRGSKPAKVYGTLTEPFHGYRHENQNYCVVGGVIYRGDRFPQWKGYYIFGDNQSSRVWAIHPEDPTDKQLVLQLPIGKRHASLTSIASDSAGRIFFTSFASGGEGISIHELVQATPLVLPERLSETGYFQQLGSLTAAEGFVSYSVNSPLWSDGLEKQRWVKIPEGTKINNDGDEYTDWKFPKGTVFIKHFSNPMDSDRPIETRVLIQGPETVVAGATYRWNEDRSDAVLVMDREESMFDAVKSEPITLATGEIRRESILEGALKPEPSAYSLGGGRVFSHQLPGPNDCLVCHTRDNCVLGINALQLNRSVRTNFVLNSSDASVIGSVARLSEANTYSSEINELVEWSERGLLTKTYSEETVRELKSLVPIEDDDPSLVASIELRARSYLHSNCSFCHHPEGTQRTVFDARFLTPLQDSKMIREKARTGYMAVDGQTSEFVIDPGRAEKSALFRRLRTSEHELSMPYLGRSIRDQEAIDLVETWIGSMKR
jgi:glucose/arabinose dehydrogenase